MSTTSNISIRMTTSGDVVLDQLISAIENPNSTGTVYVQVVPPNVSTPIFSPFSSLIVPSSGYTVTGLLILPPQNNPGYTYTLSTQTPPPDIHFHPTNPMFLPMTSGGPGVSIYIYHTAPIPLVFQLFWI